MSIVVTTLNETILKKARHLLGAKSESETVEIALKKVIEEFNPNSPDKDLPEDFLENLFVEDTGLFNGESIQAILKEREEAIF